MTDNNNKATIRSGKGKKGVLLRVGNQHLTLDLSSAANNDLEDLKLRRVYNGHLLDTPITMSSFGEKISEPERCVNCSAEGNEIFAKCVIENGIFNFQQILIGINESDGLLEHVAKTLYKDSELDESVQPIAISVILSSLKKTREELKAAATHHPQQSNKDQILIHVAYNTATA